MTSERPGGQPGSRRGNRWLRAGRVLYLAVLAGVLAWLLYTRQDDIRQVVAGAQPLALAGALALALGQLAPSILLWTIALRRLGASVSIGDVASATARSLPARYVPGSVWYALGRAALLRREQAIPAQPLGAAAALETVLAPVSAIGLGSALLVASGRVPAHGLLLGVWFVVLLAAGSPPALNAAMGWIARRRGVQPTRVGWSTWGLLVGAMGLHWLWSAATFVLYLRAFPHLDTVGVVEIAGSFLLAWALGFLAIFAPQGAGVFEASAAAMLSSVGTAPTAIVVAGYRALVLVRDGIVFVVALLRER